mmetsp:Transcript_23407/g.19889  ORF Transcript_23407/g.19889 Transcript_23407/m.19889 type:complete len:101 (+) Transcript_23407:299-601(+)
MLSLLLDSSSSSDLNSVVATPHRRYIGKTDNVIIYIFMPLVGSLGSIGITRQAIEPTSTSHIYAILAQAPLPYPKCPPQCQQQSLSLLLSILTCQMPLST